MKRGATLVLGETDPDLEPFFLATRTARVLLRDRDFAVRRAVARASAAVSSIFRARRAATPMCTCRCTAGHQADNAAIALAAAEAFVGAPLPPTVVADGFASVRSPGRLEVVGRHPLVLLDGAHNVAGAAALRGALDEEFAAASRTLLVGLLAGEGAARDARPRSASTTPTPPRVLPAAEPARARSCRGGPGGARTSASRAEHIEVTSRCATRSAPRSCRPPRTVSSSSPDRSTPSAPPVKRFRVVTGLHR